MDMKRSIILKESVLKKESGRRENRIGNVKTTHV